MKHYITVPSPLGDILLTFDEAALDGLYFAEGQKYLPAIGADWQRDDDHPMAGLAASQLACYFDGAGAEFDLPLRLAGTPFQQRVWQVLREIPPGRTFCYADVAQRIGAPQAVRAVGAAIGRNPISIVVPCHRVIGRGGALIGYAGGLTRKHRLLQLEGAQLEIAL